MVEYSCVVYMVYHLSMVVDDNYLFRFFIKLGAFDYLRVVGVADNKKRIWRDILHRVRGARQTRQNDAAASGLLWKE